MRQLTENEKAVATDIAITTLAFGLKGDESKEFILAEAMRRVGTVVVAVAADKLVQCADEWYDRGEK